MNANTAPDGWTRRFLQVLRAQASSALMYATPIAWIISDPDTQLLLATLTRSHG